MSDTSNSATASQGIGAESWTLLTRILVFALGATSIGSLILHFYGIMKLQFGAPCLALPAFTLLGWACFANRTRPDHQLSRQILIGVIAGFLACVAYDMFRLPFVLLSNSGSHSVWALPLFKVMPAFGRLILGRTVAHASPSLEANILGWTYHFSNGVGLGIMYVAAMGNPSKRHWLWAVAFAVGLEIAMLTMPYADLFSIRITPYFVLLTLTAHLVFGVTLGLVSRRLARQTPGFAVG
jgi:hypothetical protein